MESIILRAYCRPLLQEQPMIAETLFWMILFGATRVMAKTYERRCDVLYGPYVRRTDD
jgi:hypothetical protein